jgi:DNA-binding transcriptional regulator YhcF (GntR family)
MPKGQETEKEYNILNLLCNNIIQRFEKLEEAGLIFHKQKQTGKVFIRELQKLSDVILDVGKESDEKAYKEAMNDLHKLDNKLDEFLDKLYK